MEICSADACTHHHHQQSDVSSRWPRPLSGPCDRSRGSRDRSCRSPKWSLPREGRRSQGESLGSGRGDHASSCPHHPSGRTLCASPPHHHRCCDRSACGEICGASSCDGAWRRRRRNGGAPSLSPSRDREREGAGSGGASPGCSGGHGLPACPLPLLHLHSRHPHRHSPLPHSWRSQSTRQRGGQVGGGTPQRRRRGWGSWLPQQRPLTCCGRSLGRDAGWA